MSVCVNEICMHIILGNLVHCRELGGSCKLILDVIKCEPPVIKVINYNIISKHLLQCMYINLLFDIK